jgi:hypothetical protein
MGKPHLDTAAVHAAGDQSLAFDGVNRIWIGQLSQRCLAERLAQGEEFQHSPLGAGQVGQTQRHQLDKARGGSKAP